MTRFAFYQEVRVARPVAENSDYAGLVGAILGIGDAPGQPPVYGVAFDGHEQIGSFEESELEPTGRQFRREDFYDDTKSIRVRVDAQGRGHAV